jgi:hypothetical protein
VPLLEILAGKCGFAGQMKRHGDGSDPRVDGNVK